MLTCCSLSHQGYKHRGAFLATQAPLDSTVNDLWRMVWENQSKAMITLCEIDQSDDDDDDDKKQDEEVSVCMCLCVTISGKVCW